MNIWKCFSINKSWSRLLIVAKTSYDDFQVECVSNQKNFFHQYRFKPIPKRKKHWFMLDEKDTENGDEETDLIEKKRNKSGLQDHHYKIEHNQIPDISEDEREIMDLWSYRKLFGKFGSSSNVEMKALWPSTYEIELLKEREKIEYPHTVQEMIELAIKQKIEETNFIMARQEQIIQNLKKLDDWKMKLKKKLEKKELEAKLELEVKQKQIDDVREILGYNISPYDPKFQEILDKKLEEDKKREKKEKKLRKQQEQLQRLREMAEMGEMAEQQQSTNPEPIYGKKIE